MPPLNALGMALIKQPQSHPSAECTRCDGDLRLNFCRQCHQTFWDGHAPDCKALTVDKELHHHDPGCVRVADITYRKRFDADEIVC